MGRGSRAKRWSGSNQSDARIIWSGYRAQVEMGANSSSTADIASNDYLKRLAGTESISENDPFWNQLLSFTFTTPTNGADTRLLEEATLPISKLLIENNPCTGNLQALVKVFLNRTNELKISAECQDQLFIWQAHNALFIIRCLLKTFVSQMPERSYCLTLHTKRGHH